MAVFKMNNKIPYTSYSGNSEHLCKKGDAVEFIPTLVHANFYHTRKYRYGGGRNW